MRVGVVVDEYRVTDDGRWPKHPERIEPLNRGQSMPPGDLVKLGERLCGVGLPAESSPGCFAVARLKKFGRTSIDLGRTNQIGRASCRERVSPYV